MVSRSLAGALFVAALSACSESDETPPNASDGGGTGGAGGAVEDGAPDAPQIDASRGAAGAACQMIRFDGGHGWQKMDAGCGCPEIFRTKPHGTPCSEATDCAKCTEGTCWAECVRCDPTSDRIWWVTCTE